MKVTWYQSRFGIIPDFGSKEILLYKKSGAAFSCIGTEIPTHGGESLAAPNYYMLLKNDIIVICSRFFLHIMVLYPTDECKIFFSLPACAGTQVHQDPLCYECKQVFQEYLCLN